MPHFAGKHTIKISNEISNTQCNLEHQGMQQPQQTHGNPGVLNAIQHWGPMFFLSLVVNVGLLKLFVLLIAIHDPVATEKSRLHVRLVQNTAQPQTQTLTPKPKPEPPQPMKKPLKLKPKPEPKPKPKPKVVKSPQPVVKPPPPVVKSEQPPPEPQKSEEIVEAVVNQAATDIAETTVEIDQTQPERVATSQPAPSQAPVVAKIVPLFRLTRMPKVVDYNLETLKRFYPEEEREFGKEATVEAMILVDENGKIVDIDIIKSAGARFDEAAKKALLSNALEIEPGYIGDKPVASRVPIPITFNLTD
jgi:protein TonB